MTFPSGNFGVIYADPPWSFKLYSSKGEKKSAQSHYACMGVDDLKRIPVGMIGAPDCVCFMWATWPMINVALDLMAAWGFTYKSGGAWRKTTKHGKTAFGTGYIFRSATEPFLVGTRGKPIIRNRSTRNYIEAMAREHSRKPESTYGLIEGLWDGPYLEVFARQCERTGWTAWGNEVGKFNPLEAAE